MKVLYRINSEELLYNLYAFFNDFIAVEQKLCPLPIEYVSAAGKFSREFVLPTNTNYSPDELGKTITNYIKNFDMMLKKYLSKRYENLSQMETDYKIYLSKSNLL